MTHPIIKEIEQMYAKSELPDMAPGDTVKVMVRIKEGNKERLQGYEGVVLKIQGAGLSRTVTVRRVFQGVGVERAFLLHSPTVDSIKVLRRGKVRRARLYYLRQRTGKAARIRERVMNTKAMAASKA
jgi:large subunit ribosomal protein L19